MRPAFALLPYAVTSLLVVASSAVALSFAVADVRDLRAAEEARGAAESAAPTARAAGPELSRTGRLAYWRTDPSGATAELFVSNVDGSLRRILDRSTSVRRMSLTRWTPSGDAVSYVEVASTIVRIDLAGAPRRLAVPADARAAGYTRILDLRWSPNGTRVAATVARSDLRTDVFLGAAADRELRRATTLEDVFANDWLDDDRVLVHTGGGIVGVLAFDGRENAMTPLVGLQATSPILGEDGRIHFLAGTVSPSPRDTTLPYLTASAAMVWSVAPDGSGLKQETSTALDDVKLDARYGPGRYLARRGSSSAQVVLGEGLGTPPIEAGAIERAIVAPDGRTAIGFSSSRMIRYEVTRDAVPTLAFMKPQVMLDLVAGGDVWHPRTAAPASVAPREPALPPGGYAFALGGHLWLMKPDGSASFLRARSPQTGRRTVPAPSWSPDGTRLLAIELAGTLPGLTPSTPLAVTIDRQGDGARHALSRAALPAPSWSPDGSAFVVVVDRRGVDAFSAAAELEARFIGLDGRAVRPAVPARDAVWTRSGVLTLTDRAVELHGASSTRTVVEIERVLADPRGEFPADRQSVIVGSIAATPDGAFASFRLNVSARVGASRVAIAVVRVADGAVVAYLPGLNVADLAWSPAGARVGYTSAGAAVIRDEASGTVVASWSGRFAGWAPDGRSAFVARQAGLFLYPLSGADGARVSALGVPVVSVAVR